MYSYSVYHNGGLSSYLLIKLLWCSLNILFCVLCYLIVTMCYILRMLCKFSGLTERKKGWCTTLIVHLAFIPLRLFRSRLCPPFASSATFLNLRYLAACTAFSQLLTKLLVLLLQTTFLCPSKTKCGELPLFA